MAVPCCSPGKVLKSASGASSDVATGKLELFPVDGGKAAFNTFKYAPGWVGRPKPADLGKDIPPTVDDDYAPFDPLPAPGAEPRRKEETP